ncbi:hypothetical protein PILCRDRAFT_691659 [Piloderma croceum F 1598]|uniref:F-box domain-containing protein n=1 Tax=Piloderma croceum (strain F 1598) TaxID=765440 RepID=A0A0C3F4P2_PILCF|nr:hypothetical protein PILCRDRAFT_691659 [Piloderma croceum F 1598]
MEGLPAELWDKVMSKCLRKDQAALCRVSKYFGILTTRQMYRTIILRSPSQIMRCCRSITLRGSNATAVRTLLVDCGSWQIYEPLRLAAFYPNILAALSACGPNLLHLDTSFYLETNYLASGLLQEADLRTDLQCDHDIGGIQSLNAILKVAPKQLDRFELTEQNKNRWTVTSNVP